MFILNINRVNERGATPPGWVIVGGASFSLARGARSFSPRLPVTVIPTCPVVAVAVVVPRLAVDILTPHAMLPLLPLLLSHQFRRPRPRPRTDQSLLLSHHKELQTCLLMNSSGLSDLLSRSPVTVLKRLLPRAPPPAPYCLDTVLFGVYAHTYGGNESTWEKCMYSKVAWFHRHVHLTHS